jgi:subtilisin family serine protease
LKQGRSKFLMASFLLPVFLGFLPGSVPHAEAKAHLKKSYFENDDREGYFARYNIRDGRRVERLFVVLVGAQDAPAPAAGPYDPNDPLYQPAYQWDLDLVNVGPDVWTRYRGNGIVIAVIDSGLLYDHEDIRDNVWVNVLERDGLAGVDDDGDGFIDDVRGWDFVEYDNDPLDLLGHGTFVAGIAAAVGNNSKGIIGVAPEAKIMPVRVLDENGSGTFEAVAAGIRYAAFAGADVINVSLGAFDLDPDSYTVLKDAVDYARSLGSVIVAAAGNYGGSVDDFFPASLDGVLAIGAVSAYDERPQFSNFGNSLFLMAPGSQVLSLGSPEAHVGFLEVPGYYTASGTSASAPFVSGAIALILEQNPGLSLAGIRQKLIAGAVDLGDPGFDPYYGYGRLDVARALAASATSTASVSVPVGASTGGGGPAGGSSLAEILSKNAALAGQAAETASARQAGAVLLPPMADHAEPDFLAAR